MGDAKPVVISLHGIRTRGEWQKRLSEILSAHNMICVSADYGYLSIARFIASAALGGKTEWFLRKYQEVVHKYEDHLVEGAIRRYPSLVAHSFGTFIGLYSMKKYEEIRFDKVIICGSILPDDFPWELLFQRDQVAEVRHEYGARDIWTKICAKVVPKTGSSGTSGFKSDAPHFHEEPYADYRHSDFFSDPHIENAWLPLLKKELPQFTIKHGRELQSIAEFKALAAQTFAMDEKVYGHIPEYKNVEPDITLAQRWLEVEPDAFTFLIDQREQKCIGYATTVLVKPKYLDALMDRGLIDKEMIPDVLASSQDGQPVSVCALSIVIDPQYRVPGQGYHSPQMYKLLAAVCAKFEYFVLHRGVQVRELAAGGWTDYGVRICENIIGMPQVSVDEYRHPLYRLRITPAELKKYKRKPFKPLLRLAKIYEDVEKQT